MVTLSVFGYLYVDGPVLARFLCCAFFAVLFLQSGFDTVADWKGNLEWLTGHFSKSPFKGVVPVLLGVLTAFELASGLLSLAAFVTGFFSSAREPVALAFTMCGLTLVMLFTGQRLAKDYPGAAVLAAYFAVALLGLMTVGVVVDAPPAIG